MNGRTVFAYIRMATEKVGLPTVQWAIRPPISGKVPFGMSPHRFVLSPMARLALAMEAQRIRRAIHVVPFADETAQPIKVYQPGWKNILAIFLLNVFYRRG